MAGSLLFIRYKSSSTVNGVNYDTHTFYTFDLETAQAAGRLGQRYVQMDQQDVTYSVGSPNPSPFAYYLKSTGPDNVHLMQTANALLLSTGVCIAGDQFNSDCNWRFVVRAGYQYVGPGANIEDYLYIQQEVTPFAAACGGRPNPLMLDAPIQPVPATATVSTGSAMVVLRTIDDSAYTAVATGQLFKASDLGSSSPVPVQTVTFGGLPGSNPPPNKITATFTGLVPTDYALRVTSTDHRILAPDPTFTINPAPVAVCDLSVAQVPDDPIVRNPKAPALGTSTGEVKVRVTATGTGNGLIRVKLSQGAVELGNYNQEHSVLAGEVATFTGLASGIYLLTADIGTCVFPKPVGTNAQVPMQIEIPEPDLEIGDQLTFLPWVQSELAAATSTGASGRPELTLSTQLRTSTATAKASSVLSEVAVGPAAAAQIYGAGDVLGVNLRAILGTTPVPGATGASALQLAAIEFQEEDLPWRYSTRRALDANGTPAPWLFLLVLKASEYARPAQGGAPSPSIQVLNASLYPDPDARQQAQWAHVQLNAVLGTPPATTLPVPSKEDINTFLHDTLPAHPALAYSRVFCPRRLEADTAYRAFLLPATEAGRLAGLGLSFTATNASEASFPTKTIAPDLFPIYFEWEFETGAADDFEDLAQQLHQANGSTRAAVPVTL